MNGRNLQWKSLPYKPGTDLIQGTLLAMAFVPGTHYRFAVYERRTRTWDEREQRHYPSITYVVKDAATIGDDEIREGCLPNTVFSNDDVDVCVAWAASQS